MDQLLSLLSENARLTTCQLAAMLNLPEAEVTEKIARYEKEGIIRGYKAIVNWEKIDKNKASALINFAFHRNATADSTKSRVGSCSLKKWKAFT